MSEISATANDASIAVSEHEGYARMVWRRFRKHKLAVVGAVLVVTLCLSAVLAGVLTPHSPTTLDTSKKFLPPFSSATHILGTDDIGRDTLSRLLHGGQVSLAVGIVAMIATVITGTIIGVLAGFRGLDVRLTNQGGKVVKSLLA